jgi:hypothetical protein
LNQTTNRGLNGIENYNTYAPISNSKKQTKFFEFDVPK